MNYIQNDNELIYLINEDSDQYRNILFDKYRPVISSIVSDYYSNYLGLNIDYDDLFQEGMIGFNNAINSYDSSNSIFYSYASLCIKRSIISYIRKLYSKKNLLFNNILDDSFFNNYLVFDNDIFLSSIYEYEFINIKNSLNDEQSLVFELRFNGFSNKEISVLLDISVSRINRIVCKIKVILKNNYNNY